MKKRRVKSTDTKQVNIQIYWKAQKRYITKSVYLFPEDHERLKAIAAEQKRSLHNLLLLAIEKKTGSGDYPDVVRCFYKSREKSGKKSWNAYLNAIFSKIKRSHK